MVSIDQSQQCVWVLWGKQYCLSVAMLCCSWRILNLFFNKFSTFIFFPMLRIRVFFLFFFCSCFHPIFVDSYHILYHILIGAYGQVWLAHSNKANEDIAIKMLKYPLSILNEEDHALFEQEMKFIRSIRHSNIVQFYGAGPDTSWRQCFGHL